MKLPAWFPHPAAWLSAVALLVFSRALLMALAIALPLLGELARYSPRLAAMGGLALWLSPVAVVAAGHRVVTTVLDVGDPAKKTRARVPRILSWWAGLYAWLVLLLATTSTMFLLVIINPPPPEGAALGLASVVASGLNAGASFGVQTALWLLVAAGLYHFERIARLRIASSGD
jgi:hypothetical protein